MTASSGGKTEGSGSIFRQTDSRTSLRKITPSKLLQGRLRVRLDKAMEEQRQDTAEQSTQQKHSMGDSNGIQEVVETGGPGKT